MSADQIVGWSIAALAAGVLVGIHLWAWTDARRSARRLAAAETAFWQALQRVVDGDNTPARAVGDIRSVKRMREQIADNHEAALRELRAEIERWESA